ncbi:DUF397 domain-containing protein [Lentzea sp. NPDC102401]|uniref:DUF397 domain-containing protein n=1 Tax=Lentzea sp. NPDC102401 TaxID=3364128 RepID=UPI00382378A5
MTASAPTFEEADFRKSSRSVPDKDCVHIARRDGTVEVRDTKKSFGAPDDHRLSFTAAQFDDFLARLARGELSGGCIEVVVRDGSTWIFRSQVPQRGSVTELEFTTSEFTAFRLAAADGEFAEHAFSMAA